MITGSCEPGIFRCQVEFQVVKTEFQTGLSRSQPELHWECLIYRGFTEKNEHSRIQRKLQNPGDKEILKVVTVKVYETA